MIHTFNPGLKAAEAGRSESECRLVNVASSRPGKGAEFDHVSHKQVNGGATRQLSESRSFQGYLRWLPGYLSSPARTRTKAEKGQLLQVVLDTHTFHGGRRGLGSRDGTAGIDP